MGSHDFTSRLYYAQHRSDLAEALSRLGIELKRCGGSPRYGDRYQISTRGGTPGDLSAVVFFRGNDGTWYAIDNKERTGRRRLNAIGVMTDLFGMDFKQAVDTLAPEGSSLPTSAATASTGAPSAAEPIEKTELYIPPKREGKARCAAAYLVSTRCLPSKLVSNFFTLGLIYEAETKKGMQIVAFPFRDLDGNIVGVDSCGVYSSVRYKQMQPGSDTSYAWRFTYGIDRIDRDTPMYFCESAIDAMSLCALYAYPGVYLSMSGLKDSTLSSMVARLGGRPVICTDNDDSGNRFRAKHAELDTLIPAAEYKDWNGELQYRVGAGLDYALKPQGRAPSPTAV